MTTFSLSKAWNTSRPGFVNVDHQHVCFRRQDGEALLDEPAEGLFANLGDRVSPLFHQAFDLEAGDGADYAGDGQWPPHHSLGNLASKSGRPESRAGPGGPPYCRA